MCGQDGPINWKNGKISKSKAIEHKLQSMRYTAKRKHLYSYWNYELWISYGVECTNDLSGTYCSLRDDCYSNEKGIFDLLIASILLFNFYLLRLALNEKVDRMTG